jgi:hypothetical protein
MQVTPHKRGLGAVQLGLGALALLAVAFAPPAQGRMLLVPLTGAPVSVATVNSLRATPLLAGPLPGSLVVEGDRGRLSALWSQGVLVLAAPAAICGGAGAKG